MLVLTWDSTLTRVKMSGCQDVAFTDNMLPNNVNGGGGGGGGPKREDALRSE